ncbi:MAG: exopolyphosphatase [Planctomycetes bacterium]|nr:exopolyphosphatase [Planctomycetota bacterium]
MKKYRLITKGDFDGLGCAILLKSLDIIESILFTHPKEIERGNIKITDHDIMTGLPYREEAHLVFDNYPGSIKNAKGKKDNFIIDTHVPSTTKVVYNYFGGKKTFPKISDELLTAVDKGYTANFTTYEILYPSGWDLLNYIIDQRTGLEKFGEFRSPHYQLMLKLVDYCKDHTILEILSLPEIEERIDSYFSVVEQCKEQILRCASLYYNLAVIDFRHEDVIYPGNRFIAYALYPECNISLQILSDASHANTIFVAGKSIIDRSFKVNIGRIMSLYGGGGHANAGTCQVPNEKAEKTLEELIKRFQYGVLKNLILGYFH